MNSGPSIFLAAFLGLAASWGAFILAPELQIGGKQPTAALISGEIYPAMRSGLARQGEQVYRANGCYYCHSQQVQARGVGSDVERGWGGRPGRVQSIDNDYLYDAPVMIGNQRVGPDLANIGIRQTNDTALYIHLYNPQLTMPKSVMPPYRFLFEKRKLAFGTKPSSEALPVGAEEGYEVVPTEKAKALVTYLASLHSEAILFETPPLPKPKTNSVAMKGAAK
jgi:cytochrome c oxidase cbb3-type subunit 2